MAEVRVVRRASASASARVRRLWRRAKSGASAAGRRVASWKRRWSSRASETTRVETASEEASTAQTAQTPSEPAAFASGCVPSLRWRQARRGPKRGAHSPSPRRRGVDGEDAVWFSGKQANALYSDDAEDETRTCPSEFFAPPTTPRGDEEPKPNELHSMRARRTTDVSVATNRVSVSPKKTHAGENGENAVAKESADTSPRRLSADDENDELTGENEMKRANLPPGWVASPVAHHRSASQTQRAPCDSRVVSRENRRDGEKKSFPVKDPSPRRDARTNSRSPSSLLARLAALSKNVDSRFEGLDSRVTRWSEGQRNLGGRDSFSNGERKETSPSTETEGPLHALVRSVVAQTKRRLGNDDASDDEKDDDRERCKARAYALAESNKENDENDRKYFRRTKTPSAFVAARAIQNFERVTSLNALNEERGVVTKALLEDENAKALALKSLFDGERDALVQENALFDGLGDLETEEDETKMFAALEALVTRADALA